jgi:hypothetical protein
MLRNLIKATMDFLATYIKFSILPLKKLHFKNMEQAFIIARLKEITIPDYWMPLRKLMQVKWSIFMSTFRRV